MEKKMTKLEVTLRTIDVVKAYEGLDPEEKEVIIARLEQDVELLSKKRSRKTKTQKANEKLVEVVYDAMKGAGRNLTVTEIYGMLSDNAEITSPQKVSALVKKLRAAHRVDRTEEKGVAYFFITDGDAEDTDTESE